MTYFVYLEAASPMTCSILFLSTEEFCMSSLLLAVSNFILLNSDEIVLHTHECAVAEAQEG